MRYGPQVVRDAGGWKSGEWDDTITVQVPDSPWGYTGVNNPRGGADGTSASANGIWLSRLRAKPGVFFSPAAHLSEDAHEGLS